MKMIASGYVLQAHVIFLIAYNKNQIKNIAILSSANNEGRISLEKRIKETKKRDEFKCVSGPNIVPTMLWSPGKSTFSRL